jgi:hypothetical protein
MNNVHAVLTHYKGIPVESISKLVGHMGAVKVEGMDRLDPDWAVTSAFGGARSAHLVIDSSAHSCVERAISATYHHPHARVIQPCGLRVDFESEEFTPQVVS